MIIFKTTGNCEPITLLGRLQNNECQIGFVNLNYQRMISPHAATACCFAIRMFYIESVTPPPPHSKNNLFR